MNKSGQTGPQRSLKMSLVLLLQVKFCFCSQKQPLPTEQIDPAIRALGPSMVFHGFQCISSKLLCFLQRAIHRSLAVPHRELLNCCHTLPFIYRHSDKTQFFHQGLPFIRLVPLSWPIRVSGAGRVRRPEELQGEVACERRCCEGQSLGPREPRGASGG